MIDAELLQLLKTSLHEPNASPDRTLYLTAMLKTAKSFLQSEGVTIEGTDYSIEDASLIVMYAEFLITKRQTSEGMPRYLRWAINNRLFGQSGEEIND